MRRRGRSSRAVGVSLQPTPISSNLTTPLSSAYPSTYASEVEGDSSDVNSIPIGDLSLGPPRPKRHKPFPFMDLPSELRLKVYEFHFAENSGVVDLDPDNHKRLHRKLAIFKTCRQVYSEASHLYYSTRPFRIFPTHPGRFFKTKKPLLARLTSSKRACLTSLELRLGPGWNKPPRGWVVNPALGLHDCVNVRRLNVFVECDPSDAIFKGFRRSEGFYEGFSRGLLEEVLTQLPQLHTVHFDAWSSVKKSGAMMRGLLDVTAAHDRMIRWGPERGWTEDPDEDEEAAAVTLVPPPSIDSVPFSPQQGVLVMA